MVSQDDDDVDVMFGGFFNHQQQPQWSLVTIRDSVLHPNPNSNSNNIPVFPPVNHENLQIQDQHHQHQPSPVSDSNTLQSPTSNLTPFHLLRTRICSLFANTGFIRTLLGPSAVLLICWWWLCRRIRRRRDQRRTVEHLNLVIKQKDEVSNCVSCVCENAYKKVGIGQKRI